MQENYLAKWLNNELSEEELAEFKQSAEFASYQKILGASGRLKAPEFDVDQAWDTFKTNSTSQEPKVIPLSPFKQFLRVAAVIAVLLAGAYFYLNSGKENFSTQFAERTQLALPDNSEVFLNAGSELSYNEKQWGEQRQVKLEGEAFFKVAKGKKFTVVTEAGAVAVLGTQFNVENREGFFEVTCYEGLVRVTFKDQESKLAAGDSFVAINGLVLTRDKIIAVQPSWMENESTFKSIPLKYVLAELERQFDITISADNIDTEQLFTGTFNNTDLHLALESISTPSQIGYKLEGDKVLFYAGDTP
ncbi:MAG: FecR domain-containing protein [Bacteroidota bacterium]